jgi:ABC-type nitrate/sulfonate/bicarbonate transport system substrate-binding protein
MPNLLRVIGCLILALTGLSAAAAEQTTIRVAGRTEPVMIAIGKGWFKDAGLNVEVTELPNMMQYLNLLASGSVDVVDAYLPATFWNMVLSGAKFKIISGSAVMAAAGDGEPARNPRAYVARKDLYDSGVIRSIKDFASHKIADSFPVPAKGSISPFPVTDKIFGEDFEKIDWNYIPIQSNILTALDSKYVDGARLTRQWAKIAIEKGLAVELEKETDFVPLNQLRVIMAREDFLATHEDAIVKFLHARLKGEEFAREVQKGEHKDEFADIVAKNSKTPPLVALDAIQEVKFTDKIATDDLMNQQRHFAKVGIVPQIVDLTKVIDLQYLAKAKQLP